MDINASKELIKKFEGLKLKPYKDSLGHWTVGYGHNLNYDPAGITDMSAAITTEKADELFEKDMQSVFTDLARPQFKNIYSKLDRARQAVMENMMYSLGATKLAGFKQFLVALDTADYEAATKEMLNSVWSKQVGERAVVLSNIMKHGKA